MCVGVARYTAVSPKSSLFSPVILLRALSAGFLYFSSFVFARVPVGRISNKYAGIPPPPREPCQCARALEGSSVVEDRASPPSRGAD